MSGGSNLTNVLTKGILSVPGINTGGVFGKWDNIPKTPQLMQPIQTPRTLPTFNSDAVKKAQTNALLNLQNKSGRASTMLTSQTFGG